MKISYFEHPNFGDNLNSFLWKKIFNQKFFEEKDNINFIGIGSIAGLKIVFNDKCKNAKEKIVLKSLENTSR
jgi:hypothetical protein